MGDKNRAQNLLPLCDSLCGLDSYLEFAFAAVTKAVIYQLYSPLLYFTKRMKKFTYEVSLWMYGKVEMKMEAILGVLVFSS